MAKIVIEVHHALPCSCEVFTINGINADENDFGSTCDMDPDSAEEYGCGDRQFNFALPTDEILKKYSITLKEYGEICYELENCLAVGSCGWCI